MWVSRPVHPPVHVGVSPESPNQASRSTRKKKWGRPQRSKFQTEKTRCRRVDAGSAEHIGRKLPIEGGDVDMHFPLRVKCLLSAWFRGPSRRPTPPALGLRGRLPLGVDALQ